MHLVVGSGSCFGRAVVAELRAAGEPVHLLDAGWLDLDTIIAAMRACSPLCVSITVAVELPMSRWDPELLRLAESVCAAAELVGATILLPTGLYGFKVVYDVPLPADPPLADVNDTPCEPGRIRDAIEATYAQLAELRGNRVVMVRAGDTFGPGGVAWPAAGMFEAARAKSAIPWPGPAGMGHSFTFLPDLARLGVRALLGPPLPRPQLSAEQLDDPDLPPQSPAEVYALHGHLVPGAKAWAERLGAPGVRRIPQVWTHAVGQFRTEERLISEVLYTWAGAIFLDDRRTRSWIPGFEETPLADAVAQTLAYRA